MMVGSQARKKRLGTRRRKTRWIHCHPNGVMYAASCGARGEGQRLLHLGRSIDEWSLIEMPHRRIHAQCYGWESLEMGMILGKM